MKPPKHLKIDESRNEVYVRGKIVRLAPKEYDVLVALNRFGCTLSRERLMDIVYPDGKRLLSGDRMIDIQVSRLRRKLKIPAIETVITRGYKIAAG